MCTALSLDTNSHYFGRTLDLDCSYGEELAVMPRRFPLSFRKFEDMKEHYAIMGMASIVSGIPLFYDAVNEHGVAMAGLNFPGNAYYAPVSNAEDNIAPFELIPWILSSSASVREAKELLSRINIADIAFSEQLPPSPLHWMISDREEDIVVETMRDGIHIHQNTVGVMTNNPPFEYQMENLKKYRSLRNDNKGIEKETELPYVSYCQGLGAVGLPGDVSSMSRFVRAAFARANSVSEADEEASVTQFFHILSSVSMLRGICKTDEGTWDITGYTSCMNTDKGIYYYTTYGNSQISCVDMHRTDLNSDKLSRFPLARKLSLFRQN